MSRSAFIIVLVSAIGCSANGPGTGTPAPVAEPAHPRAGSQKGLALQGAMDLGVVIQGTSVELRQWVKNQGTTPVEVAKITTSCECLSVRLSKSTVGIGERVLVHLHYDGAKEPEFVGSLQIEVELLDDKGTKVGQIDVPIEVVRAETAGEARD